MCAQKYIFRRERISKFLTKKMKELNLTLLYATNFGEKSYDDDENKND